MKRIAASCGRNRTVDCADPDCAADATCAADGLCAAASDITCGSVLADTTSGGTTLLEKNACDTWLRTGFEKTYRLQPAGTGSITVTLTDMTRDVDLLVLAKAGPGACNPRNPGCLATSANFGTADESVTFAAQAGETYYLVVDSYGYRNASFTLAVSCP